MVPNLFKEGVSVVLNLFEETVEEKKFNEKKGYMGPLLHSSPMASFGPQGKLFLLQSSILFKLHPMTVVGQRCSYRGSCLILVQIGQFWSILVNFSQVWSFLFKF